MKSLFFLVLFLSLSLFSASRATSQAKTIANLQKQLSGQKIPPYSLKTRQIP